MRKGRRRVGGVVWFDEVKIPVCITHLQRFFPLTFNPTVLLESPFAIVALH